MGRIEKTAHNVSVIVPQLKLQDFNAKVGK